MFDRTDSRPSPPDIRYPQSTDDELAPGAIFAAIIAAFLVIGIVVYSILSVSPPPQANTFPPPETTGRGEPAPIPPAVQPPANPKTIPPIRPLEVPPVPPVR